MTGGGNRIGAGRPKGTTYLKKWQRLAVGLECERCWKADRMKLIATARDQFRKAKCEFRSLKRREKRAAKCARRRYEWTKQLDSLWIEFKQSKMLLDLVHTTPPPRPYGNRHACLTLGKAVAEQRFGRVISIRTVSECWLEFRKVSQKSNSHFDYL